MECFVKAKEVAKHLQIDEKTVYAWASKGVIKSHRFGRCVRFKMSEVIEWTEQGKARKKLFPHIIDQKK